MDTFEDDYPKNLYVIRRKLSRLRKPEGYADWHVFVGDFTLSIVPCHDEDDRDKPSILDYQRVDVNLTESSKQGNKSFIDLRSDQRFSSYKPIMYDVYETPTGGLVNWSDGHKMPIVHLLELIKLLHRLAGLTAFQ